MGKFTPLDFEKYVALARQAAAEGCVLLKNDNEALPLRKGDKVAVFGRIAFHYYKSGLAPADSSTPNMWLAFWMP